MKGVFIFMAGNASKVFLAQTCDWLILLMTSSQ